jgi:hypothetical protein
MTKQEYEMIIFRSFFEVYPFASNIDISTIQNCKPPEPDILCVTKNNERIYFELGRIEDKGKKKKTEDMLSFHHLFKSELEKLPVTQQMQFEKNFSNVSIHFHFRDGITNKKIRRNISKIVDFLITLNQDYEGTIRPEQFSSLIRFIDIARFNFNIQSINRTAAGSYSDPIYERLVDKFQKSHNYICNGSIDLLVYYELQEPLSYSIEEYKDRLRDIENYILKNISTSRFTRVWGYDYQSKKILFVFPQV